MTFPFWPPRQDELERRTIESVHPYARGACWKRRVVNDDLGGLDRVSANERLFLSLAKSSRDDLIAEFACECVNDGCVEQIRATPAEYEPVRSSAARYVVSPNSAHVDQEHERVVDRRLLYWVVEREASVETLAFYSRRERTITAELTALAADPYATSEAEPPAISIVPPADAKEKDEPV